MIQIYHVENTNYKNNGDIVLLPSSCRLTCGIKDTWELSMEHPVDSDGRWKHIEENAVIACPTFQSEKQLFRISKCEKTESFVTVTAYPIFFDSADDCFLMDIRPTGKNGQDALDILVSGSKYSAESDIDTQGTAYFVRRNLMDAINGENDPTFIGVWGGEILYDNYKVIINSRIGTDNGVDIRYGKNMNGLQHSIDMSDVITRIIPIAYNGRMIDSDTPWVDSSKINTYPIQYIREVKFEDVKLEEDVSEGSGESTDIICSTQEELDAVLVQKCNDLYASGADLPSVTIRVNMVELEHTEQYENFSGLLSVGLGDTVHCYNSKLDISTDARVIKLTWDCIRNQAEELTLGDYEYNYFSSMTSSMQAVEQIIGPGNTVMADRVQGILNAMTTQFRAQKNIAQTQDVRAILFEDINPDSPTFGALCIGTQGIQIAHERTSDGTGWKWGTAINFQTVNADYILTGKISSRTGEVYFDLDANNGTGELAASILKGVEEGSTTTARVGIGTYAGGDTYEGLSVRTTSGAGGSLTIGIDREVSDYTLANKTDLFASGDLTIRSQAISANPGGNNGINLSGNSTTGEGYVRVFRGNPNGTESILISSNNGTTIYYDKSLILGGYPNFTTIRYKENNVLIDEEKIEFAVGGYSRASIESNGAYFGNIYSNGILVTSDRKKKSNISRYSNSALDQVKSSAVYQYRLLTQEKTKKGQTKTKANQFESIGILFDEAPSEIRRTDSKGNNTVDLYGMVSILWKAVQELSEKIERLEGQTDGI